MNSNKINKKIKELKRLQNIAEGHNYRMAAELYGDQIKELKNKLLESED